MHSVNTGTVEAVAAGASSCALATESRVAARLSHMHVYMPATEKEAQPQGQIPRGKFKESHVVSIPYTTTRQEIF